MYIYANGQKVIPQDTSALTENIFFMSVLHTINHTSLDTINYTIELVKMYLKCREYLSFFNGPYILENQIIIGIFIDLECVRKFGFKTEFMIHMFTNCIILHKKWNRKP